MPLFTHRKAIRKVRQIGAPNQPPKESARHRKESNRDIEARVNGFCDAEAAKDEMATRTLTRREQDRRRQTWSCPICPDCVKKHNSAEHMNLHYDKGEIDYKMLLKYKNPNKYMKISNKIDELKDFVVPKMAAIEEYKEKTTVDVARNMRDIAQTNDRLNAELKKMAVEAIEQKKREEYLRRQNDSLLAKQELMEADMKSFKEMLAKIISNAPALTNSS
jgi:hypothetical protein